METRVKILASSQTAQAVEVTGLVTGLTSTYPSGYGLAALALHVSTSIIMNKLNLKNTKPYKGRYVIKALNTRDK
jgi:hypothetical protein